MDPFTIAMSAAGSAMQFASGFLRPSLKKQYKYQKKFLDDQTAASKELYDYQFANESEYNDPSNYFKRLMAGADANGLSKAALMDGGAAGQSGVQHQGMSGSGSGTSYDFAASDLGSKLMQNALIGAQIRNLDSQANKNNKDAGEGGVMDSQIELNTRNAELAASNSDLLKEKLISERVRQDLERANTALLKLQADRYNEYTDAQIDNLIMSACSFQANANYTNKQNQYYDELVEGQIQQTRSQVILNGALAASYRELANKYGHEAVAQLQQNEHWARTVQDLEDMIAANRETAETEASFSRINSSIEAVGGVVSPIVQILGSYLNFRAARSTERGLTLAEKKLAVSSRQRITSTLVESAHYDKKTKNWTFTPKQRTKTVQK